MLQFVTIDGDVISVPQRSVVCLSWTKADNKYWVTLIGDHDFEIDEVTYQHMHEQYKPLIQSL